MIKQLEENLCEFEQLQLLYWYAESQGCMGVVIGKSERNFTGGPDAIYIVFPKHTGVENFRRFGSI